MATRHNRYSFADEIHNELTFSKALNARVKLFNVSMFAQPALQPTRPFAEKKDAKHKSFIILLWKIFFFKQLSSLGWFHCGIETIAMPDKQFS